MLRVNGRAYDWGDVDFQIPGLNIEVQEISYNDELEKEVVYGAGQRAAQGDKSLKVDMDFIIVNGITRDGVKAV